MPKKKPPTVLSLFLRMLLALFTLSLLSVAFTTTALASTPSASQQQYLALGDSLAFGFQPNLDFTHGYANDLIQTLQQQQGFSTLTDLGCPSETSSTFINGNCPVTQPPPPQLASAIAYLQQNPGKVGLVTLQIGANDLLPTLHPDCTVDTATFTTNLATLDDNLVHTILPQLHAALESNGNQHAHLVLVKYYNPFQPFCPNTTPFVQTLNAHLEQDAKGYVETVDIFNSFDQTNALVCELTWICDPTFHDIHPNDLGYQVIANDIYQDIFVNGN